MGATLTVSVSASDADGPAPLVLTTSALPGSASFSDAGDGSGTLSWTPLAGDVAGSPYSITVTATDGAGLATSETFDITVLANGAGQLTPTLTAVSAGARFNLTSEGSSDWLHWYTGINRKGAVTPQLAVAAIGGTPLAWNPPDSVGRPRYDWSDGTPTASNSTDTFVYQPGVGRGFELSAPADTSARTLVVYVGGSGATGRLEARLSDASAPVYSETVSAAGNFDRRLTLSYRAASAGQTLTVTWVQTGASGNISFSAASLQGAVVGAVSLPFLDDFSDGNLDGWLIVDQTTNKSSQWIVSEGTARQTARVESTAAFDQSYHLGSYAYLGGGLALSDYRLRVEAQYLAPGLAEDIGILFRYRDVNNFYRLSVNSRYGFTRLEKRTTTGGYSALATDARGYRRGEVLDPGGRGSGEPRSLSGVMASHCSRSPIAAMPPVRSPSTPRIKLGSTTCASTHRRRRLRSC